MPGPLRYPQGVEPSGTSTVSVKGSLALDLRCTALELGLDKSQQMQLAAGGSLLIMVAVNSKCEFPFEFAILDEPPADIMNDLEMDSLRTGWKLEYFVRGHLSPQTPWLIWTTEEPPIKSWEKQPVCVCEPSPLDGLTAAMVDCRKFWLAIGGSTGMSAVRSGLVTSSSSHEVQAIQLRHPDPGRLGTHEQLEGPFFRDAGTFLSAPVLAGT